MDEDGKPPVSGYEVGHKEEEAGIWPDGLLVAGRADTSVTITGLTNDQRYHVRVRTVNDEGGSPWSAPVGGVPAMGPGPRGELRDQTALIGRDLEISLASLFTRPARGTWTYDATSSNEGVATVTVSDTLAVVRGVAAGRTTITATAANAYGNSAKTTFDVVVTTPPDPPPTPPPPPPPPRQPPPPPRPPPTAIVVVCGRTAQVRDAIVAAAGVTDCAAVTAVQLSAISELRLSDKNISTLTASDFSNLTSVKKLHLVDNNLETLATDLFDELTALEELYLGRNRLTTLPENLFANVSTLRKISLRENIISTLPANLFSNPSPLKELYLTHNDLTSVNGATFSGLAALEKLALNQNNLHTGSFPAGFFAGLPALKSLWLSGNRFPGLTADFFSSLTGLEELYLPGVGLTTLPANLLSNLVSLEVLSLSHNELSSVSATAFSGLTSLEELWVDFSELESDDLPSGVFSSLSSLRFLSLRGNGLQSLPAGVFSGLTALTRLDLTDNPTDPLPIAISLERVATGQFKAMAHTGAPFDMTLPLQVVNGTISGGATSIFIPRGGPESDVLTVNRTTGTTAAVTVDIASLPSPPSNYTGLTLVKSADLPLQVIAAE